MSALPGAVLACVTGDAGPRTQPRLACLACAPCFPPCFAPCFPAFFVLPRAAGLAEGATRQSAPWLG